MGKNAGVKVIADSRAETFYISQTKNNSSRRMQGEEIYYSQTEEGRRFMTRRCAVQCSGRTCFNRFKSQGHGVTEAMKRSRQKGKKI
jgi:hypothetical protein